MGSSLGLSEYIRVTNHAPPYMPLPNDLRCLALTDASTVDPQKPRTWPRSCKPTLRTLTRTLSRCCLVSYTPPAVCTPSQKRIRLTKISMPGFSSRIWLTCVALAPLRWQCHLPRLGSTGANDEGDLRMFKITASPRNDNVEVYAGYRKKNLGFLLLCQASEIRAGHPPTLLDLASLVLQSE